MFYVYSKCDITHWGGGDFCRYDSCSALQKVMIQSLIVSLSVALGSSKNIISF